MTKLKLDFKRKRVVNEDGFIVLPKSIGSVEELRRIIKKIERDFKLIIDKATEFFQEYPNYESFMEEYKALKSRDIHYSFNRCAYTYYFVLAYHPLMFQYMVEATLFEDYYHIQGMHEKFKKDWHYDELSKLVDSYTPQELYERKRLVV